MGKERFETSETHLEGIQLRREPGVELDILRRDTEKLYELAKNFALIDQNVKKWTEARKLERKNILQIVQPTEGLRGLISEKENFILATYPSEKVSYDRDLLKEDLGISYPAIVREKLWFSISIPVGYKTEKGITISEGLMEGTIINALTNLGISTKELTKIVHKEIYLDVDEKKIDKMIKQGKVKLRSGTKKTDITWNVKVEPLKKYQPIKIAAST